MGKKFDFDSNPVREAFRAGNQARKKETAQDTVSDIIQASLSVEELEQAFKQTDNLRDKAIYIIHEIADKHDLGISIEAVKQPSSPFNRMTRQNAEREWAVYEFGDMIGTLKWRGSAGMLEWLTIVPTDTTIAGCTLFNVDPRGQLWHIYRDSLERLRRMLMRLPGTDMNEAFRAGNRARKKETAQDIVQDVEIDRMPDWSGTPLETFKDMHRILTDIDLSTKRVSTDDSIFYQEFMERGKKKPFESFSAAVFDAGCCIDFYLEDDVITMTALPTGRGVMTLFSPSPGYRKTHRPYIESNMGHPQWKVDPELWTELLSWIDKHEVL